MEESMKMILPFAAVLILWCWIYVGNFKRGELRAVSPLPHPMPGQVSTLQKSPAQTSEVSRSQPASDVSSISPLPQSAFLSSMKNIADFRKKVLLNDAENRALGDLVENPQLLKSAGNFLRGHGEDGELRLQCVDLIIAALLHGRGLAKEVALGEIMDLLKMNPREYAGGREHQLFLAGDQVELLIALADGAPEAFESFSKTQTQAHKKRLVAFARALRGNP